MSDMDHYHQYIWAIERLQQEFGAEAIQIRKPEDGAEVLAVEVRNPDPASDRPLYRVVFKDHLLQNLNKQSAPDAFIQGEIENIRGYFEGKRQDAVTIP